MKFLAPSSYTCIDLPIYIDNDRYWIDHIVVSPTYNTIHATCKEYKEEKYITLNYNHQNGNYENTKAEYFMSEYNVGDFFLSFEDGYWYGIIKVEIRKDNRGYWRVIFLMKNKDTRWQKLSEASLFTKIKEHKLKFAFTDNEKIKDYSKTIDEQMSKVKQSKDNNMNEEVFRNKSFSVSVHQWENNDVEDYKPMEGY